MTVKTSDRIEPNMTHRVAARIRELREQRGWSVRELSRRSKLAPESVSRSERGITEVTITNLSKICTGLGLSVAEFFAPIDENESLFEQIRSDRLREERLAVLNLMDQIPSDRADAYLHALMVLAMQDSASQLRLGSASKAPLQHIHERAERAHGQVWNQVLTSAAEAPEAPAAAKSGRGKRRAE